MTNRRYEPEQPASGYPPEAVDEVTVPPTDPVREAKQRDIDDPADVAVDPERWRNGGPTATPGAATTTGGVAGPAGVAHRHHHDREPGDGHHHDRGADDGHHHDHDREPAVGEPADRRTQPAPTTTGDATTGGVRNPDGGTTRDTTAGDSAADDPPGAHRAGGG